MNLKNLLITFTIALSLLLFKNSIGQNEYLISYEKLVEYEPFVFEAAIPLLIDFEKFPINKDSVLTLLDTKYGVELYKVLYNCEHPVHGFIQASAAVVIPKIETDTELPMAVYQHGTTFSWDKVPSYPDLEESQEHLLGAVISASGYISLMPDYLGLGDSPFMHPYSHAESTANAGRDLIRAFKEMADSVDIGWNEEIFITGYSQGGHGAMALFKALEENHCDEFTVTACSALSGAYSISGVMEEVMFREYSAPKYLPYTIVGYQSVYPDLLGNSNFNAPFKEEYGALNNFEGNTKEFFEILNQYTLPRIPIEIIKDELVEEFKTNDDHPFRVAMRESDNFDWDAKAPLFIQGCCDDEQVSIENARLAHQSMQNRGKTNLHYADYCEVYPEVGTLRHSGCIPYCLLQTKAFFDEYKNSEAVKCNEQINSLEEQENTVDYNLHPNPVSENFTYLNIDNAINESVNLTLYKISGQVIWSKNETQLATQTKINVDGLANGFYVVQVQGTSFKFSLPLLVKK